MKLKSLLFGSAAILAAGTGAQAADLPTAEPVEYVRICDAFGTGFYYIPGTETCLRVGGRVRVESAYVDGDDIPGNDSEFNNYSSRARGQVFLDARTQTDMGLIRAFVRLQSTVGFSNTAVDYDSSTTDLDQAFVQIATDWGTLTFGHVDSFFDTPFSSNTFGSRIGIDDPTTSQTLFAYTFATGAFSATLSVEDPASSGRRDNAGEDDYEGQEMPDLVGNIRYSAGWGDALLSAVVGQIHDVNGDGVGWAINGGFNFSIPNTIFGAGLTAGYADGRIHYITNDRGGAGDFDGPQGDDTNTAWAIRGGVSAKFTPTLGAYVDGSWTSVDTENGNADYDEWDIAADLQWTPVSGLTIGPEVAYRDLDSDDDAVDTKAWSVMWRIQRDF